MTIDSSSDKTTSNTNDKCINNDNSSNAGSLLCSCIFNVYCILLFINQNYDHFECNTMCYDWLSMRNDTNSTGIIKNEITIIALIAALKRYKYDIIDQFFIIQVRKKDDFFVLLLVIQFLLFERGLRHNNSIIITFDNSKKRKERSE